MMSAMNKKVTQALAETISRRVQHFNQAEAERLIREFDAIVEEPSTSGRAAHGLNRDMLKEMLHRDLGMTDEMIMDRVFRIFDKDNDGFVTVEEWIEGLAVFLRGTLDEKIKYCYSIYDLNSDHYISRDEIFHMLKDSLKLSTDEETDEAVRDLVEITLKKLDHDRDGRVSFEDYEKAVREENLLLEALGTCLPDLTVVEMFERQRFQDKVMQ